jgi:hypothetical protein
LHCGKETVRAVKQRDITYTNKSSWLLLRVNKIIGMDDSNYMLELDCPRFTRGSVPAMNVKEGIVSGVEMVRNEPIQSTTRQTP